MKALIPAENTLITIKMNDAELLGSLQDLDGLPGLVVIITNDQT